MAFWTWLRRRGRLGQFVEGGDDDEAGIYLEEFAERFAALAATETVGAERGEATGRPFGNHGGRTFK